MGVCCSALGVVLARFFKKEEGEDRGARRSGFAAHRACQSVGVVLMLAGFAVIAAHKGEQQFVGAGAPPRMIVGIVVVGLGILQPINAFFRPRRRTLARRRGDGRGSVGPASGEGGWAAVILGVANCARGAAIVAPGGAKPYGGGAEHRRRRLLGRAHRARRRLSACTRAAARRWRRASGSTEFETSSQVQVDALTMKGSSKI